MITKRMVRDGIRNRSIRFVTDPNMKTGTVCQIGEHWIYFGGETAEWMQPEDYLRAVSLEDIVNEVFDVLEDFRRSDETFGDEYAYYEAYLNEQRAKAIPTLKERDKRLEQLWAEFADVPMNPETEKMEEPFLHFPARTDREEIWHWFDERHSKGVVYLLYGTEPKYSFKNMAPLVHAQSLCTECDAEHCVFNPGGICKAPFVIGRTPSLSDDGCADFCYKGD